VPSIGSLVLAVVGGRVVDLVDQHRGLGEPALGAGARREDPRVDVERRALGQQVAGARAGDADAGPAFADLGDGGRPAVQGLGQLGRQLGRLGARQPPLVGAEARLQALDNPIMRARPCRARPLSGECRVRSP
jgi:hypothetical protein